MTRLLDDGFRKIKDGLTSVDEVATRARRLGRQRQPLRRG